MPRTLAQNAQYIAETIKPAIKSAIEAQGVTVPSTDSFLDYADRIAEIEGGGSGYQLKDLPTGSISTVNDAAELPLNALKVSVEAWQEGSGDPSPSNVRPIHGWDSGEITVVGKNLIPLSVSGIKSRNTRGSWSGNTYTINNVSFEILTNANNDVVGIKLNGTNKTGKYFVFSLYRGSMSATMKRGGTYTITDAAVTDNRTAQYGGTFTISNNWYTEDVEFLIAILSGQSFTNTILYPQLEIGTQATTYEPYQGKQYTLDFPQTIYGAEWDVVDGDLKQTDGYIASYNGESLPSTWISDRDVYDGTNTPTIGAEVVYKLALINPYATRH